MESLVDELAEAQLATYKKLYLKDREIQNIIIMDDYISPWAIRRAGNAADKSTIELQDFDALMELLHSSGTMGAAKALGVAEEKVPLVMISAVLTRRIAKVMGAKKVWAPGVTLCDGMAYEYAEGEYAVLGMGAGQPNRVDALRTLAIPKAEENMARLGLDRAAVMEKTVLASDAFFPFADNVEAAAAAGVRYLVEPGGSKQDGACIEAADRAGVAMVFTGRRHFLH